MRKNLWHRWKRLAHRAAEIQSTVVLTVLYWVVVAPIGLIRRIGRQPDEGPVWKTRPPSGTVSVEDARRQF
jgi:hypothetical protein